MHRHDSNKGMPLDLTKHQIVYLLLASLSPNENSQDFETRVQESLNELQAQGEILAGTRNRYCIAPPSVVLAKQENCLLFRGDRTYLQLAHDILQSQYDSQNPLQINVDLQNLSGSKEALRKVGIRLLTADESVEHLSYPCKPKGERSSSWSTNPFFINWGKGKSVR
ncbi:hypothetical protein [Scytonema sp. NUACC26]|uniref:hypothetical protein n=1 Tax=Scytonema sp. NUACC26 TaxID=3140176 RepID=UPI0038B27C64